MPRPPLATVLPIPAGVTVGLAAGLAAYTFVVAAIRFYRAGFELAPSYEQARRNLALAGEAAGGLPQTVDASP